MGEYAVINDGRKVKIGTCEDLSDLRADQVERINNVEGITYGQLPAYWAASRFRFPFPDEDAIAPGNFTDYDRSLPLPIKLPFVTTQVAHRRIQFKDTSGRGILAMLPCPEAAPADEAEAQIEIMRNGYAGELRIVQQRVWDHKLVLVAQCGSCGARFRLPDVTDVLPILEHITATMRDARTDDPDSFEWWNKIATRILDGYNNPPAWVRNIPNPT